MRPAIADYSNSIKDVRELPNPARREEDQVRAAVATLDKHIVALDSLADQLQRSGPYFSAEVVEIRENAIAYTRLRAEVFRDAKRCLEIGKDWKRADEKAFDEKWKKLRQLRDEWEERLR